MSAEWWQCLFALTLAVGVASCAWRWDDTGFHYSVAFVSAGKHEVDRLATDAEHRVRAECYVHGNRHEAQLETGISVWTDETLGEDDQDPVCLRETEFLDDLGDAARRADLLPGPLLTGVTVVEVTGRPSCKAADGTYGRYPLCTNGFVVELARGLALDARRAALDAGFRALLQARLTDGPWARFGLGEPTGGEDTTAWESVPGWGDAQ